MGRRKNVSKTVPNRRRTKKQSDCKANKADKNVKMAKISTNVKCQTICHRKNVNKTVHNKHTTKKRTGCKVNEVDVKIPKVSSDKNRNRQQKTPDCVRRNSFVSKFFNEVLRRRNLAPPKRVIKLPKDVQESKERMMHAWLKSVIIRAMHNAEGNNRKIITAEDVRFAMMYKPDDEVFRRKQSNLPYPRKVLKLPKELQESKERVMQAFLKAAIVGAIRNAESCKRDTLTAEDVRFALRQKDFKLMY